VQDIESLRISFFAKELDRMYSKEFAVSKKTKVVINTNCIFESFNEHDIQFDVHPTREVDTVLASTFIRNDQLKDSRGPCS